MSVCVALVLLLSACSVSKLAYQRLDWLANWKLEQFVVLNTAQERSFERAFQQVWHWHRTQELPLLQADLRALAEDVHKPSSVQMLGDWRGRADVYANRIVARALPASCQLVASFNDEQRASILRRLDQNLTDDAKKYLSPPLIERQERAAKRARRTMERWIGDLSAAQLQEVRTWSQTRVQRYEEWMAERRQWRERVAQVLETRESPQLCEAMRGLFPQFDTQAMIDPAHQANARAWTEFLSRFSATLSDTQRRHLRQRLLDTADDLGELSEG